MLYVLPDSDELYQALINRDGRYDGRVFVGVTSTGIFCKLTCSARKPKRENCVFYENIGAAVAAGFRACKICKPMGDDALAQILQDIEANPEGDWREQALRTKGFEPRSLRRQFQRQYGMSLSEMVRQIRLRIAMKEMEGGAKIIDAQIASGFASPQGFRDAFSGLLGVKPSAFREGAKYKASWIETPLGDMIAICDDACLHLLEFVDRKNLAKEVQKFYKIINGDLGLGATRVHGQLADELREFFAGSRPQFDIPVQIHADGFTASVWRALMEIPAGQTCSYGELAKRIGKPTAFRAVANANARNQIAVVIPCHRVIGADGKLTGYAGGVWRKEKLIEIEKQYGA